MASDADVCNEALSAIGVGDEIQDLDTESSKEAKACRRFLASSRDIVLRDFTWPRFRVVEVLALVDEDPLPQFAYSYREPANSASIIRLQHDLSPRRDDNDSLIPYELGRDDTGTLIYTNLEDASIQYIYRETSLAKWTPDMTEVLVNLLASKIAPRFGPEAVKLGDRALKLYAYRLGIARAKALNEEVPDPEGDTDTVRARG
jgi:hypothetical protein